MKVYITKYALTKGIIEAEGEFLDNGVINIGTETASIYFQRRDWHTSRKSAYHKASDMRDKKIKSLEKQIKRLKDLVFDW